MMPRQGQRPSFTFQGLPVFENPLAVEIKPNRVHKRRRCQTAQYHRRIQKKWTKRFGTRQVPACYVVDLGSFSLTTRGSAVVMHPSLALDLRTAVARLI